MRILVVDDEPEITTLLQGYLVREGYEVETALTGHEALEKADATVPDLIVLDLMLPGLDGFEVIRRLRESNPIPIVMLTARDGESDKLTGLDLGADDYLTKPFSPKELIARIRAVMRRTGRASPLSTIQVADLHINLESYTVRRNDDEIRLTATEFKLLLALAEHPGRVFTRLQLIDRLHGYAFEGYERTIDAHIKNLRHKVEKDPRQPTIIVTVFGVGYKLEDNKNAG